MNEGVEVLVEQEEVGEILQEEEKQEILPPVHFLVDPEEINKAAEAIREVEEVISVGVRVGVHQDNHIKYLNSSK